MSTFESTLHNGTIIKGTFADVFSFGAAFQRYCTQLGISKTVSLAMFLIDRPLRAHYYTTEQDCINAAGPGFAVLQGVNEINLNDHA